MVFYAKLYFHSRLFCVLVAAVECWLPRTVSLPTTCQLSVVVYRSFLLPRLEDAAETSDLKSDGWILSKHLLNEGMFTTSV